MITNGENRVIKLVCVMRNGSVGLPCGACREFFMQLDKDSLSMEILKDYETGEMVTLGELLPDWWGGDKYK